MNALKHGQTDWPVLGCSLELGLRSVPPSSSDIKTGQRSVKFLVRKDIATMPFFRKTEISEMDLGALAVYLAQLKQYAPRQYGGFCLGNSS
jgi:hypothetical protein